VKISLNWLTDYVDVSLPTGELAGVFKRIGLPVEETIATDTDVVLDLEVTSNRPDCLGHLGVARELAAATGKQFNPPQIGALPASGRTSELTSIEVLAPDLCPRYTARVICGVKVGPSPAWMVERLEAVGMRSINNVVDATNYVLMEYSQPLHSFDYDKLEGRRIVVRRAAGGEVLVSIDRTKCELDETMLVIADARRPVAIAGVMGGLNTEVSESTVNVLIESAQFDPLSIRRTSRKLLLMSDSNYRFERGVDPVAIDDASLRACQLIVASGGGSIAEGLVDVWAKPHTPAEVAMRPARCGALLGIEIPVERQERILAALGLAPMRRGERIVCTIPPYRADLTREIDLIEEVGRIHGYDNIPVGGQVTHPVVPDTLATRIRRLAGEALAMAGFDEAVTFSFVDAVEAELFGHERCVTIDKLTRKTNNVLRPTLLPSLLSACKTNQDAGNDEVCLFEIAACFPAARGADDSDNGNDNDNGKRLPDEYTELALVSTNDLAELRGALETLVEHLAPRASLTVCPRDHPHLAPGRAATVLLDGKAIGSIGQISEPILHHYGLERPIAAAAVRFQPLIDAAQLVRIYEPLPRLPAVRRDLSLIVDEPVTWQQLSEAIARIDQPLRQSLAYVTTYRGKPVPSGRKSVTVALEYRAADRTLRREEVDSQVEEIIAAMRKDFSAELRS
jgi:phenylalanyl-tRNA synthetase beta chain